MNYYYCRITKDGRYLDFQYQIDPKSVPSDIPEKDFVSKLISFFGEVLSCDKV